MPLGRGTVPMMCTRRDGASAPSAGSGESDRASALGGPASGGKALSLRLGDMRVCFPALVLLALAVSCSSGGSQPPSPTPPPTLRSLAQARGIGIGAAVGPEPLRSELLLLDESYRPKPAYYAIMDALAGR